MYIPKELIELILEFITEKQRCVFAYNYKDDYICGSCLCWYHNDDISTNSGYAKTDLRITIKRNRSIKRF